MSIFGKKPAGPAATPEPAQPLPLQPPQPPPQQQAAPAAPPAQAAAAASSLYEGPRVDIPAIYKQAKLTAEELDRVMRAEELLKLLPASASRTREVVDATFRAFGVDRTKIVNAASKQLDSLEAFVRFSHEQTQRSVDASAKRIAELEAEIAKCRQVSGQATNEGQERARVVNDVLLKLERVIEFFGDETKPSDFDDVDTAISGPDESKLATPRKVVKPTTPPPRSS